MKHKRKACPLQLETKISKSLFFPNEKTERKWFRECLKEDCAAYQKEKCAYFDTDQFKVAYEKAIEDFDEKIQTAALDAARHACNSKHENEFMAKAITEHLNEKISRGTLKLEIVHPTIDIKRRSKNDK